MRDVLRGEAGAGFLCSPSRLKRLTDLPEQPLELTAQLFFYLRSAGLEDHRFGYIFKIAQEEKVLSALFYLILTAIVRFET